MDDLYIYHAYALSSWLLRFQIIQSRGRLCFQGREDDVDIAIIETSTNITRKIINQVLSFLWTYYLTHKNIILHSCYDLLVLRKKRMKKGRDYCVLKPDEAIRDACMRSILLACMHGHRSIHSIPSINDVTWSARGPNPLISINHVGHGTLGWPKRQYWLPHLGSLSQGISKIFNRDRRQSPRIALLLPFLCKLVQALRHC